MKAYQIGDQTGLDSLTPTTRPELIPGRGEAVLRVKLVCLNHRDMLVLSGAYGARRPPERVPLSEGVGEVIAIGDGVTGIQVGDRAVFAHFVTWIDGGFSPAAFAHDVGITHDGWLAEQVKVPAAALVRVPDTVSDEQAAPLASSALTAWHALVSVGQIKAGDRVLALGTGGVSIFALQLAKASGAQVAITSSSDAKLDFVRSLGADICINYRTTPNWAAALMEATGNKGADIVVETGGQATLGQSISAAAVNGRIVIIGALAGAVGESLPNYASIIGKNLTLKGIAEGSRAMLTNLVDAVAANDIHPVIDRTFAFDDAANAYRYLHSGAHVGKVMIKVS
ncbi:NAD(P)-dependent alcohol dehydrogenase [Sphingomonas sp. 28-63-12]|uniref:zinc-dependent alcohol dehydrogenase family protein n=1 Tax=Sphingomonas sp. 28-63-12 TaxID=1970434 RepID=UPI000BC7A9D0|nr:MAG: alcohol dehydrogenase [Sphingomonas sp. 28-63-12]